MGGGGGGGGMALSRDLSSGQPLLRESGVTPVSPLPGFWAGTLRLLSPSSHMVSAAWGRGRGRCSWN